MLNGSTCYVLYLQILRFTCSYTDLPKCRISSHALFVRSTALNWVGMNLKTGSGNISSWYDLKVKTCIASKKAWFSGFNFFSLIRFKLRSKTNFADAKKTNKQTETGILKLLKRLPTFFLNSVIFYCCKNVCSFWNSYLHIPMQYTLAINTGYS